MMTKKTLLFVAVATAVLAGTLKTHAQTWERKTAPLMTTWGENIDPEAVWQQYPRPQLVRDEWMNLNGLWKYYRRTSVDNMAYDARQRTFNSRVLVPFGVESALSGIMAADYDTNSRSTMLYQREFTLPESWNGRNVLLHFGAVDWKCNVYVNGQLAGNHTGGFDPFTIDITDFLTASGEQELQMTIQDPGSRGGQPIGKQSNNPSGIWYTPVSGIWQTVWLEPVDPVYIDHYEVYPDIDNGLVGVRVVTAKADATATITVRDGDNIVTEARNVKVNQDCPIAIPDAKLWSPDEPNLYDLDIQLSAGGTVTDHARGYFGMRKFSRALVDDKPAFLLNNKPIYMYGPLDQGWWPDGLLTPPSYEAMVYDLEMIKAFGMNMVRKHIKVEPDLWYEWCDRNGLIVWQDMPNAGTSGSIGTKAEIQQNFYDECVRIVNALKQHPSIAAWVVYNEAWGQDDGSGSGHTARGVNAVRKADEDPYRLLHSVTGWTDFEMGDILDIHSYPAPNASVNPQNERVNVCGEFGGITLLVDGHLWAGSQMVYTSVANSDELTALYNQYTNVLQDLQLSRGLWGSVYTQITDVEQEVNGLLTYDRKVIKVSPSQMASMRRKIERTINSRYVGANVALDAADTKNDIKWQYTTSQPEDGWYAPSFNDTSWKTGTAGFGTLSNKHTDWNTSDIWLRRHFTLDLSELGDDALENLCLRMFHDENTEVYINGVQAIAITGYNTSYQLFDIDDAARQAINPDGDNVIAIHCHQTAGGQYIDAGLSVKYYRPNDDFEIYGIEPFREPEMTSVDDKAYLMAYFTEGQQQLLYAYSYDGKEWKTINAGRAVFDGGDPTLVMRDPFLQRVVRNGKTEYHLVCTWGDNHTSILHWQSEDLIHWTAANGGDGKIPVADGKSGRPDSDRANAPEFYYDAEREVFYIYFSTFVNNRYTPYYTSTSDWKQFTTPRTFFNPGFGVTDLHVRKIGRYYYAFFKDTSGERNLCMGTSYENAPIRGFYNVTRMFSNTYPEVNSPTTFPSLTSDEEAFLYTVTPNGRHHEVFALNTREGIPFLAWKPYGEGTIRMPEDVRQGSVEVISRDELSRLLEAFPWDSADLLPTAETSPQEWRYTTQQDDGWEQPGFNDSRWNKGLGGFGNNNPPASVINTRWTSSNISLRRNLDLTGYSQEQIDAIAARLHHDEDIEVYLNGIPALQLSGYVQEYENYELAPEAKAALKADDSNVIAIHCKNGGGAQYVDFGLTTIVPTAIQMPASPSANGMNARQSTAIYNLSGQQTDTPRGIVIQNGRKVVGARGQTTTRNVVNPTFKAKERASC